MIKRLKKKRIVPETSRYVSQRYEDTAVIIYVNIREGKGIYSAFVPWIQAMLIQYIPSDELRQKHWHDQVPLYYETALPVHRAWKETITMEPIVDNGLTYQQHNRDNSPINDLQPSKVVPSSYNETLATEKEKAISRHNGVDIDISRIQDISHVHENRSKLCLIL